MTNLSFKWGLLITTGLIVYFLIMKLVGLVHVLELRYLNAFIMLGGIALGVKEWKKKKDFNYFKGLAFGIATGFIAAAAFAIFSLIYVTILDPQFMQAVKQNEVLGEYMTPALVAVQIFIEGSASAFLFSYVVMQWQKVSRFKLSDSKEY